ncbi:MAG: hypothetical protein K6T61_15110 [Bryobacteraceae bacterium]|nr:hypothetical protein [Bryobacteraceae bacterium]
MELSRKKELVFCLSAALLAAFALQGAEIPAEHEHWRKGCPGVVQIDERGIRFLPKVSGPKAHQWSWAWQDVQRLELSERRIVVVTYEDVRWRLGADRAVRFRADKGQSFVAAYYLLRDRDEVRLAALVADKVEQTLWEVPVKRLGRIQGSQGYLKAGPARLIYESISQDYSITWKYKEIQYITLLAEDRLAVATAAGQYVFQLKAPLGERRYDELWRRVQAAQGLSLGLRGPGRQGVW